MGGSGRIGSGLTGLEFYDPNLTQPIIKNYFCNPTQPTKP